MSEASVDTRIVEAKFDSAQFEKGVDKTVKKLDELKNSLNLEDTGKSVADMTDKASKSLKQLEDRFTSFAGMIKQKLLSGIADEIVGVFFKIKNSFESLVSSLSIGQIGTGKSKYEQMLTSVRTMIAAGDNENAAYEAIEKLGVYSDQTSYSLDQMTSALSKMRAAGVDLGTGTKAVQGIANACAAAGVNATDAARAFYNLSQSYSSGYLRYTDYRSLELLNMTTISFKEQMLEAMEAAGTLKKVSDGVYQTINKNDKKVVANKKVTVKNLTDSLKYNIMNTESMNKLFGEKFFFGEEEWRKYKTNYNTVAEAAALAKKDFNEVAVDAYLAAREARSFTDVLNTLKDVISTGWANSFELIFGRLGEATDFFTWLTENNLAEAIYAISEFRNLVLGTWNDYGGRESLMAALENIDNFLGRIFEKLGLITLSEDNQDMFEKMFGQSATEAGEDLYQYTLYFQRFTEKMDAWLTDERATRIATILSTIGKVVSTFFRALGMALKFAISLFDTFEPVLAAVIDGIAKIVDKVNGMFNTNGAKDGLDSIQFGLDNILNVAGKLVGPLTDVVNFLSEIALFIVDLTAGTVVSNLEFLSDTLGFFIELFGGKSAQQAKNGTGVIDGIKKDVIELGNACKDMFGFIKDFFHNLYDDLRLVFGLREAEEGEEGGFFSNLANFFKTNEFITKISDWVKGIPNKIAKLGQDLWNTVDEFLFGKKVVITKPSGKTNVTSYRIKTGFSKFLEQAIKDVKAWFNTTLPKKIKDIWNTIDEFFFGKKVAAGQLSNQYGANVTTSSTRIKEGFSAWLDQAVKDVEDWIKNLPEKVTELWNTIIDAIFYRDPNPKEVNPETGKEYGPNERVKTGFLVWLEALPGKLWGWISNDLPKILKSIWDTVIGWIFGPTMAEVAEYDPSIKKEANYAPNARVGTAFSKWLESIPSNLINWLTNDLPEMLLNLWTTVIGWIFSDAPAEDKLEVDSNKADGPENAVKQGFSEWFTNLSTKISGWIESWGDTISNIWNSILDSIFGTTVHINQKPIDFDEEVYKQLLESDPTGYAATEYKRYADRSTNPFLKLVQTIVHDLGIDIGKIFSDLPAYIVEGWNFSLDLFKDLADHVTEWFKNENAGSELVNAVSSSTDESIDAAAKEVGGSKEESPLLSAIIKLGKNIYDIITKTIPGFFTEAWTFISSNASELGKSILEIFNIGPDTWDTIKEKAASVGEMVASIIRSIPDFIRSAINGIKNVLAYNPEIEKAREQITAAFTDKNGGIIDKQGFDKALEYSEKMIKDTPRKNGLWEAIKSIFGATGDFIKDIGPDILEVINNIIIWIGEQIDKVTKIFNDKQPDEDIGDVITRNIAGDEDAPSGLLLALQNIGQTIYNLITTTIPEFIKSGIHVLGQEIPKLLGQIGNIFSGEEASNQMDEAADGATKTLSEFGEKLAENSEQVTRNGNNIIDQTLATLGISAGKDITSIETAKLKQALEARRDELQADIHEHHAEYVGQGTFKTKFNELNKIKSDIEKLSSVTEEMYDYSTLDSEYGKSGAASKANDAFSNTTNMLGGFSDLLGAITNFATSKTTQAIVLVAAIAWLLSNIRDMLSISDELEAPGYAIKWTGITIAILGIVSILGYLTYLASQDDATDKFDRVKSIFDSLIDFTKELATLMTIFKGFSFGKSIFDMFTSANEKKTAKIKASTDIKNGTSAIDFLKSGAITIANKGLELLGISLGSNVISSSLENIFDGLLEAAQSIGAAIESIMIYVEPGIKRMAELNTDLTSALEAFSKFKEILNEFKSLLIGDGFLGWAGGGEQNAVYMQQAHDFLKDIMEVPDDQNIEDPKALLEKTSMDTISKTIEARLKWLYEIMNLVYEIGNALEAIEKVENPVQALSTITEVIKSEEFSAFLDDFYRTIKPWASYFYSDFEPEDVERIGVGIRLLSNALNIFTGSISGLSLDQVSVLDKGLDTIQKLATMLSDGVGSDKSKFEEWFGGDNSIGSFGRAILTFGGNMEAFFNHIKKINADESSAKLLLTNTNLVLRVTDALSSVAKKMGSGKIESVSSLFSDMGNLGSNIMTFISQVSNFEGADSIDYNRVNESLNVIKDLENILNEWQISYHEKDNDLTRIEQIKKALIGEDGQSGFVGLLLDIHHGMEEMQKTINHGTDIGMDFYQTADVFNNFALIVTMINTLFEQTKVNDSEWNPFGNVLDAFETLNQDFITITEFVNKASELDQDGLDKAIGLFTGLRDLATAINYFGSETYDTGLNRLSTFDLSGFAQALRESFIEQLNTDESDAFSPKITPVLEISDDFIYKANQIRSMFGYSEISLDNKNGEYDINNETSLDLAKSINIPTPIDYTNSLNEINSRLDTVNNSIRYMNNDLTRMAFVINGKEFAATVGPDIDEYLGEYSITLERVSGTS